MDIQLLESTWAEAKLLNYYFKGLGRENDSLVLVIVGLYFIFCKKKINVLKCCGARKPFVAT